MTEQEMSFEARTNFTELFESIARIRGEMSKVLVGQEAMVEHLMAAILSNGHVLIEGVPGVAKTLTAKLLSRILDIPFARIQFTPDLMPADILGSSVFHPREGQFEFRPGPVFSSLVLIDEINRAPAKTQAALFEVMEERQVTSDGVTRFMPLPFMVVATQNPIEHEGTYRLPEAQLDRFLFRIQVPYPSLEEEIRILEMHHMLVDSSLTASVERVLSGESILRLQQMIRAVRVEQHLLSFIAELITTTRDHRSISLGASPRASVAVMMASKAMAAMRGRDFVTPEDILYVLPPVLRHRLMLTPEKEMEGLTTDDVILSLAQSVQIPR